MRNISYIDKRAFCVLYNQRIRPHLDYGMTACPPVSAAEAQLLKGVQAKAGPDSHAAGLKAHKESRAPLPPLMLLW